jgi:general secretion pathway protein E
VRHGERVVMRILEKGQVFSLDRIGMSGEILDTFRRVIRKPHGILLVSGPTGSGKSTTLYSAIAEINEPDINILTIEDPVEYEVAGIGQVQVNHKIDLTFASALRSFLRQDPDVILVGEIRDRETAENAVQASLTGHMVFSTIHTNDAAGAFARLTDMGVEPFLVASSLAGVLAQRLVRRLCSHCKRAYHPSDAELRDLGLSREQLLGHTIYEAVGCEECGQVGYLGRVGIYEFLPAWDDIKVLVIANADAGRVKKRAVELGMRTLREDGFLKVLDGMTSLDEVMRVTQMDTVEE